jgi:hypothetical protein
MRTVNQSWLVLLESPKFKDAREGVTLCTIIDTLYTPFATYTYMSHSPDALFSGHYFRELLDALTDFQARVAGKR